MYNDDSLKFSTQYSYRLKVLLLGPKQSGKSSFIYTYKHQAPPIHKINSTQTDAIIKKTKYINHLSLSTPSDSYQITNIQQNQQYQCNIHLWDTTSQQSVQMIKQILMKRANVIILMFDKHEKTSFSRMKNIWKSLEDVKKDLHHVEVILVGNIKDKNQTQRERIKQRKKYIEMNKKSPSGYTIPKLNKHQSLSPSPNNQLKYQHNKNFQNNQKLQQSNDQQMMNLPSSRKYRVSKHPLMHLNSFPSNYLSPSSNQEQFGQAQQLQYQKTIQQFCSVEQMQYFQLSVFNPYGVKQLFQNEIIKKVMRKIQNNQIRVQDVVIKDTQGKVKLRKFDFKTHEYFQKRYNRCC